MDLFCYQLAFLHSFYVVNKYMSYQVYLLQYISNCFVQWLHSFFTVSFIPYLTIIHLVVRIPIDIATQLKLESS